MTLDMTTAWKTYPCRVLPSGNVATCPVRLGFVNVFQPSKPMAGQTEGKYGATLLFPKGADLKVLEEAVILAAKDRFGEIRGQRDGNGILQLFTKAGVKLHSPFRDQGDKGHLAGYTPGAVFITASSKQKPGVVSARKEAIHDPAQVYSGMWAIVTVRAFAFDQQAKKGVSIGLQNIMKVADGEKFSGRPSADVDFAGVDVSGAFGDMPQQDALASMLS